MGIKKEVVSLMVVSLICAASIPINIVYAEDIQVPAGYTTEKITQEDIDNAVKEMNEISKANELVADSEVEDAIENCSAPNWEDKYTLEEAHLIAAVVYAEAGHCSDEHQCYVASVILNRVEDDNFPSTIEEVIYQKHPIQYACAYNGHLDKALDAYWENDWSDDLNRAWENTEDILTSGSIIPSTVVFQAEFKQGSKVYKKLGNTYFCYR
jgi:N-acetylmuramoyl-L-alanine amidase